MKKGIFLAALTAVMFGAALFTHVGESDASFHLMRIDGAMAGFNGDSTIQYVELRSANSSQNLLASNSAVLCFFDSAGAPYAMFKFSTNPSNFDDGASYLVGSAEFDAAWAAGAPDFTFAGHTTAIPGGADTPYPIRSPGGKISFGSDPTTTPADMCQGSFFLVDSVAYGTAAYGGTIDFVPQFASDLPTSSTMGLHIVGPVCFPFSAHPCGSARDNSVNYAIVDVNATGNQPRNSLYQTGPMTPADADGDTVPDTSDNCPNWPNLAQNLPSWMVPAGDPDCDGFTTTAESFMGTDPIRHCATSSGGDDEPLPDAWPPDFNDDQAANLTDIFLIVPVLNTFDTDPGSSPRFDLSGEGAINLTDIFTEVMFLNMSCAT